LAIISPISESPLAEIVPTCDLLARGNLLRFRLEFRDHGVDGEIDAALQIHRIGAGRDGLCAFLDDGLSEKGGGGGAVAGGIGGLGSDLAHHLRAHILELVLELDLLGDGHTVLGDTRRSEGFLEHDVTALRAERDPDRIGQDVDAVQHALAGVLSEFYFLGSHVFFLHSLHPEAPVTPASRRVSLKFAGVPSFEMRPPGAPQNEDAVFARRLSSWRRRLRGRRECRFLS
jgi:hypothetical protein